MAKRTSKESSATNKTSRKTNGTKNSKSKSSIKSQKVKAPVGKNQVSENPHKTFKRSYREDYQQELNVPGMMQHFFDTFKMIFKNWKLFLPLLALSVVMAIVLVGLMSEDSYRQFQKILDQTAEQTGQGEIGGLTKAGLLLFSTITTGGLSGASTEVAISFMVLIFLMIWLVSIFMVRHKMAGHEFKFRDALYNSMTPLISTLVVFLVALLECLPIFLLIIAYSAAVQTEFLATPFYALLFFIFAGLMILLSSYLLSTSVMALVAVTAPGLYPIEALKSTADLMVGRKIKFIVRIISLLLMLAVMWVIVMIPLILFDLFMKQFEWTAVVPFIPFCLLVMTCFTAIYVSVYFYQYYRYMLEA